jgi:uncharacterized membrane protein YqaE (UPF0057 family)
LLKQYVLIGQEVIHSQIIVFQSFLFLKKGFEAKCFYNILLTALSLSQGLVVVLCKVLESAVSGDGDSRGGGEDECEGDDYLSHL